MITHDARRSLPRGNNPVPSPWQATMTEQVRAMSDQRAGRQLGSVSTETLTAVSRYLHLFIV